MSKTNINAYKAELDQAVKKALGALGEVEAKVAALVAKYEIDLLPPVVEEVSPHAQGMAASPLVDTTLTQPVAPVVTKPTPKVVKVVTPAPDPTAPVA